MTDKDRDYIQWQIEILAEDAKNRGASKSLINELQMLARLVRAGDFDDIDE